jgi:hypothetical protein
MSNSSFDLNTCATVKIWPKYLFINIPDALNKKIEFVNEKFI